MGLLSFGGSASSSQSLDNVINFNPNFNLGDNNKADSTSRASGLATSSAQNKDEFGLSASVGVLGGTGGRSSLRRGASKGGTDVQPMTTEQPKQSIMNSLNGNYLLYGALALGALFGFSYLSKHKKA